MNGRWGHSGASAQLDRGHSGFSTTWKNQSVPNQSGIALVAVLVFLLVIAAAVALKGGEELGEIELAAANAEVRRIDYVAQAGLQHALWQARNYGCRGDFTIPSTQIGPDSYTATAAGAGASTLFTLSPDQDAWVRSDNPSQNMGNDPNQHVAFDSGDSEVTVTRFDLSTLPPDARIQAAQAWFNVRIPHPEGPITIHRVTTDWTESGVTWETLDGRFDAAPLGTIPPQPDSNVWVAVNLTAQVQAWVNGAPNYGIVLASTAEGLGAEYKSRESGSTAPRLEVVVGNGSQSPVNIQATGTLESGKQLSLARPYAPAYQPPGTAFLQLGADPGEDAMLDAFYSARNYGGATYLQVHDNESDWQQYPVIRFGLGAVPPGAIVRSAQLELNLQSLNAPGTATIHEVTRSWVEGTKAGGGTADGATWVTHDGTNAWTSAGGDYNAAAVAETAITGSETWVSWDVAPLVERWLAGEPNYGLLIKPDAALDQANFASREDSSAGVAPRLTITYACECGSACMGPQAAGTILMAVVNPTTLVPADEQKKALFESWGYTVEVISESANQTSYDSAMAGADVVFISETVNSNTLGTKLQSAPIGVVSQDGSYNDDLGFAGGSAWQVDATIEIADTDHYITRPFAAGPLDIYAAHMEMLTVSGSAAPDARLLVTAGGAGALVTLDAGAMGSGGTPVPARRVMLPLGRDSNLNWDYLSGNGSLLVQRAFAWAMGADDASIGNVLLVVDDSTSLIAKESAAKTLIESWGYTVTAITASASQADYDTALASVDVVYISGTISSADLGAKLKAATVGVVSEDSGTLDDMGLAEPVLVKRTTQLINIVDNTHYVTSGLSLGDLAIVSSSIDIWTANGALASGLQVLGETQVSGTGYPPGVAIMETGAALWGGGSAAGRRVQVPWSQGDSTFDVSMLNADGLTIMERALAWGATQAVPQTVLMAVADPAALTAAEAGTKALIESWSYVVDLIDDDDTQANFDAAASLADVAFLSSDVDRAALGTKLTDATIGIVTEEHKVWNDMELCDDSLPGSNSTDTLITDNTHYITSPFALGLLTTYMGAATNNYCTLSLAPGAVPLIEGSGGAAGDPGLITLDTGALRKDGQPSTGRRVTTPWGGTWDPSILNSDGQTILRRSIEWAADGGSGPAQSVLLVVADATTLTAQDTARKTLMEGWGYGVATISASDSQANFDAAVATANAAYVVMQDSSTALGTKLRDATIAVINEEVELRADIGLAANRDWPTTRTTVDIIDNSQYITSPFATGLLTIATAPIEVVTLSGQMAGGLQVLGQQEWGGPQNSISVIDTGGALYGGGNAAGRRVQLPWGRVGFDINNLNADGLTIMQRAIEWGVAGGGGGGGGGPTGVTFEEFTEAKATAATDVTVAKPAGTAEGDLLIATLVTDGSKSASMSAPAGWTVIDLAEQGGNVTFGVWWKLAGASEPAGYMWSWTDGEKVYGTVMRFTGHDPATPINATATAGGSSSAPPSPAVTTTVADAMILRLGGFDDDDITVDAPGLAGHTAITMDKSSNGNGTSSSGAGYVMQPVAGDSGTSAFALTNTEEYRTVTIAIAPAP